MRDDDPEMQKLICKASVCYKNCVIYVHNTLNTNVFELPEKLQTIAIKISFYLFQPHRKNF